MRAARRHALCQAQNAFVPRRALWQLFAAHCVPARRATLSPKRDASTAAVQYEIPASLNPASSRASQAPLSTRKRSAGRPIGWENGPASPSRAGVAESRPTMTIPALADAFPTAEQLARGQWFVASEETFGERLRKYAVLKRWQDRTDFRNEMPAQVQARTGGHNAASDRDNTRRLEEYEGRAFLWNISPGELATPGPDGQLAVQEWGQNLTRMSWMLTSSERLSLEIRAFARSIAADRDEQRARERAASDAIAVVREILPDCLVELFGSAKTGLSNAVSDIDLRLFLKDQAPVASIAEEVPAVATRYMLVSQLRRLCSVLRNHPQFMVVRLRHARYPLISMIHRDSGTDIQIVCSNETVLQEACIARYLEEYPTLVDVFTLIKVTLDIRGLTDVFRGGLGSYSLLMMIVAALKIQEQRGGVVKRDDAGNCLQHFLEFFISFDPYKHGITVEPPGLFEKKTKAQLFDSPESYYDASHSRWSGVPKSLRLAGQGGQGTVEPTSDTTEAQDFSIPIDKGDSSEKDTADPRLKRAFIVGAVKEAQPYLLTLIDPADQYNDLGRKGSSIKHILVTLKQLYLQMVVRMFRHDVMNTFPHLAETDRAGLPVDASQHYEPCGKNEIKWSGLEWPGGRPMPVTPEHAKKLERSPDKNATRGSSPLSAMILASFAIYRQRRAKTRDFGKSLSSTPKLEELKQLVDRVE